MCDDFEIKAGDKLKVTTALTRPNEDPYLNAIVFTNAISRTTVTLHDANGLPLPMQRTDAPVTKWAERWAMARTVERLSGSDLTRRSIPK